jgi:hypothetical protein
MLRTTKVIASLVLTHVNGSLGNKYYLKALHRNSSKKELDIILFVFV